jgi:hypothetical protein
MRRIINGQIRTVVADAAIPALLAVARDAIPDHADAGKLI